jgi:hypothetical protein
MPHGAEGTRPSRDPRRDLTIGVREPLQVLLGELVGLLIARLEGPASVRDTRGGCLTPRILPLLGLFSLVALERLAQIPETAET